MSDINPNNYPGSNVTIVGFAGGETKVKEFDRGGSQAELQIGVGKGYKDRDSGEWVDKGTDWYTLVGSADYAADNWPYVQKGDKVRIDNARLEARPYTKNNGEAGVELTLRFGTIVVVEAANERQTGGSRPTSGAGTFASSGAGTPF